MPNNDHYVPQFLLRRFCDADGRLHVYDKWNDRKFVSSTRNVASEKGFYDLQFDGEMVSLEPLLCKIEEMALGALNSVVDRKSLSSLDRNDRENIAFFLGVQMLRTRAQREAMIQMDAGLRDALFNKGFDEASLQDGFSQTADELKAASISNIRLAKDFAPHFLSKDWFLNEPEPGTRFYISDNPVVRRNYYPPSPFQGNNGIASEGIQIYMPLSSELTLCLLCPTLIAPFRERQRELDVRIPLLHAIDTGTSFVIPAESVTYCNSLQVAQSERFVFSPDGEFSLLQEMLASNPDLRKPARMIVQ
jgi:hypothetical protein